MSSLTLLLLMPLLAWGLPGYLLSRWLIPNADPLERGLTTLMAGIVTVAPTTYLLVLLFKLAASPALIGIVSLLWVIIAVALQRWQPLAPNSETQLGPGIARFSLLFAISIAVVTSLSTTPLSIETVDVWWHCPHLSSLYLMEDGSGPGVVAWDPVWQRSITHLFQHPTEPAFGLGPALII
ncbi:MAG TPA: hypothetical protein EYN66_01510 [Myxococcales bacterium]|nr:hypothetical protein [Myxococcales bacterium]